MLHEISQYLLDLKKEYNKILKTNSIISEIIPKNGQWFDIEERIIMKLHLFAENNPIYQNNQKIKIRKNMYMSYQGDINEYYLSGKKYDTNYQPFYPTWLLSALILCLNSKKLGYKEIIDIGSGDGRIPYCATILDMQATSIELDNELTELQKKICLKTNVSFNIINADASTYDINILDCFKPAIFISGLPEMGEMFLHNINKTIKNWKDGELCIILIGDDTEKKYKDNTEFGWGEIIRKLQLNVIERLTLPTHWTNYQKTNTTYIFTKY